MTVYLHLHCMSWRHGVCRAIVKNLNLPGNERLVQDYGLPMLRNSLKVRKQAQELGPPTHCSWKSNVSLGNAVACALMCLFDCGLTFQLCQASSNVLQQRFWHHAIRRATVDSPSLACGAMASALCLAAERPPQPACMTLGHPWITIRPVTYTRLYRHPCRR